VDAIYGSNSGERDCFVTIFSSDATAILFSTYIGGSDDEYVSECCISPDNSIIIVGRTASSDFPTVNAYASVYGGGYSDGFLLKINPTRTALEYSTYIGSTDNDYIGDVEIDSSGYVYIAGETSSSSFPTINALDSSLGGTTDYFIMKYDQSTYDFVFSTFIGGSDSEWGVPSLALNSDSIFMCGYTDSSDFPTTLGCYDSSYNGNADGVILQMPLNGSLIEYSTFFGGSGDDDVYYVELDSSGNVVVSGESYSTDFPLESGYDMSTDTSIFVSKLNILTNTLVYSTHFGGSEWDTVNDMFLDDSGNVFLCGTTESDDFPLRGEFDDTYESTEGFVAVLSSTGSSLLFSTYVGDSSTDIAGALYVDDTGITNLVGYTASPEFNTVNAIDSSISGDIDTFLMRFNMEFTPVGTPGDEDGDGLSDEDEENIYGTDPLRADTDGDGCPDGWEVERGLDPLTWTHATGEAWENVNNFLMFGGGIFLVSLISLSALVFVSRNTITRILGKRILLIPAILFLIIFFTTTPMTVYGSSDPGSNSTSGSGTSISLATMDSPWWGNRVTVSVSLTLSIMFEYCDGTVTVSSEGSTLGTFTFAFGRGAFIERETETRTYTCTKGSEVSVSVSYHHYNDLTDETLGSVSFGLSMSQSEENGENEDQQIWPALRGQLALLSMGAVVLGVLIPTGRVFKFVDSKREEKSTDDVYFQYLDG
jgi:hypothetical protein